MKRISTRRRLLARIATVSAALCVSATTAATVGIRPAAAASSTATQRSVKIAAPHGLIRSARSIPGQYIVVLKNAATTTDDSARLTGEFGGRVTHRFGALHSYSASMSDAEAKAVSEDPSVAYVQQDSVVTMSAVESNPPSWGLDQIDQRSLTQNNKYNYSETGEGVTAYVIDSGVNATHTEFGGRAALAADFRTDDGQNGMDCNGHGTHVAGTIGGATVGVAKEVTIRAVRVFSCGGSTSGSAVIAGINWVTTNHSTPAVANMSLGGAPSQAIDDAVQQSINSGVTYAVAAGNDAVNAEGSPARLPAAITVGAEDQNGDVSGFSNYGPAVDVFAPGAAITSAWIGSNTATQVEYGTSMATPHVVGAVAQLLQRHPSMSPATVQSLIVKRSTKGVLTRMPSTTTPNRLLFDSANPVPGDLGGVQLTSPPSAVSVAPGDYEVFYRGPNNHLWLSFHDNGPFWSAPVDLGGVALQSAPSAVATSPTHVDVFYKGPNGHLWSSSHDSGQSWSAPADLGGVVLNSAPAAAMVGTTTEVFYQGPNHHLWISMHPAGGWWSAPGDLGGVTLTSGISVVAPSPTDVRVFYRGPSNHLYETYHDAGPFWSAPIEFPGVTMTSAPGVVMTSPLNMEVYYQSANAHLSSVWRNSAGPWWSAPNDLGIGIGSAPSSAAFTNETDTFYRGSNGHLWIGIS